MEAVPSPLAKLLARVYKQTTTKGEMLENMKVAVVSLIYKDKGTRDDYAKYRPIAVVSSLVYRILAKAHGHSH